MKTNQPTRPQPKSKAQIPRLAQPLPRPLPAAPHLEVARQRTKTMFDYPPSPPTLEFPDSRYDMLQEPKPRTGNSQPTQSLKAELETRAARLRLAMQEVDDLLALNEQVESLSLNARTMSPRTPRPSVKRSPSPASPPVATMASPSPIQVQNQSQSQKKRTKAEENRHKKERAKANRDAEAKLDIPIPPGPKANPVEHLAQALGAIQAGTMMIRGLSDHQWQEVDNLIETHVPKEVTPMLRARLSTIKNYTLSRPSYQTVLVNLSLLSTKPRFVKPPPTSFYPKQPVSMPLDTVCYPEQKSKQ